MTRADAWVTATVSALQPLASESHASSMQRYMKGIAPFLGIPAPERRRAQSAAWRDLTPPSPDEVVDITWTLWERDEREYQYAACDLLAKHARRMPASILQHPVEHLITTKSWWDTVDALGSAIVTRTVVEHPEQVDLMWRWCESEDRWLVRAAIQHQRGLGERTDINRLLAMCARHAEDEEFFIAKAIGWALRDATRGEPSAVDAFVSAHPELSRIALKEARRGLHRAASR